jgi:flagellar biosynthesis protein FlhF
MTVKRFVAESAREALRRVKEELGPDAIVIANKSVPGGIEITAMSSASLEALSTPPEIPPPATAKPALRVPQTVTASDDGQPVGQGACSGAVSRLATAGAPGSV